MPNPEGFAHRAHASRRYTPATGRCGRGGARKSACPTAGLRAVPHRVTSAGGGRCIPPGVAREGTVLRPADPVVLSVSCLRLPANNAAQALGSGSGVRVRDQKLVAMLSMRSIGSSAKKTRICSSLTSPRPSRVVSQAITNAFAACRALGR